jgi:hypothetical protein
MQDFIIVSGAITFVAGAAWLYSLIRTRQIPLTIYLETKNYRETLSTPWGPVQDTGTKKGDFIKLVRWQSVALGINGPFEIDAPVPDWMKQSVRYEGVAYLPQKVYVGDSMQLSILFQEESFQQNHASQQPVDSASDVERFNLPLVRGIGIETFLAVEIQAAGLTIDGNKTQKKSLAQNAFTFSWNCAFPVSGRHTVTWCFTAEGPSWSTQVHTLEHTFKVVQLDGFTKREVQVYILPIAGVLGAIFTLLQILRLLGYV